MKMQKKLPTVGCYFYCQKMEGGIKIAERGKKLPRTKPALSFEDEKKGKGGEEKTFGNL